MKRNLILISNLDFKRRSSHKLLNGCGEVIKLFLEVVHKQNQSKIEYIKKEKAVKQKERGVIFMDRNHEDGRGIL